MSVASIGATAVWVRSYTRTQRGRLVRVKPHGRSLKRQRNWKRPDYLQLELELLS